MFGAGHVGLIEIVITSPDAGFGGYMKQQVAPLGRVDNRVPIFQSSPQLLDTEFGQSRID